MSGLLQPDPRQRTTVDALLDHPWVSGGAASASPLPGSDVNLKAFNEYRKVWRAAIRAATLISRAPNAAAVAMLGSGVGATKSLRPDDLSADAREELRTAFNAYDRDGNGRSAWTAPRPVSRDYLPRQREGFPVSVDSTDVS